MKNQQREIIEVWLTPEQHSELMLATGKASALEWDGQRLYSLWAKDREQEYKETLTRLLGADIVGRCWKKTEEVSLLARIRQEHLTPLAETLSAR